MSVATEHIYLLADLKNWPPKNAGLPSDVVSLAVIGHPIAHSLSPVMHNAALAELAKTDAQFAKWRYFKFDIAPADLKEALDLFYRNKFRGLNLTVPHKVLAMAQIKIEIQQLFLRTMGAANTLKYEEGGWYGFNTDGIGLERALRDDLAVTTLAGVHVILLGSGGAARAAAVQCLGCASLWIGNRTPANRDALLTLLRPLAGTTQVHGFDLAEPPPGLPAKALVINATSLGLKPGDESPLDLEKIPRPAKVFDMIYRPSQTALLCQAERMGIPNANGLSMLVHQGAHSLHFWTDQFVPPKVMYTAAEQALAAH